MATVIDELIKMLPFLVKTVPWGVIALIALHMVLKNKGVQTLLDGIGTYFKNLAQTGNFVDQDHCHSHIDELKNMIQDEIKKFGTSIDNQLQGIRENVNTLLRAGLK